MTLRRRGHTGGRGEAIARYRDRGFRIPFPPAGSLRTFGPVVEGACFSLLTPLLHRTRPSPATRPAPITVLGHGNCGAVKGTIDGKAVPGQISSLYRYVRPAVNAGGDNLRAATEANAKIQAQLLKESSPVLVLCSPGLSKRENSQLSRPFRCRDWKSNALELMQSRVRGGSM
jgi:hypothetical protein